MFNNAIDSNLLLLIKNLSEIKQISSRFYLAGGTALALQLGHRKSDDIDLFSSSPFNPESVSQEIRRLNGRVLIQEEGTVHGLVKGIKISFLHYPYKLLAPFVLIEGLHVADIRDIVCMKVVAIAQRAQKKDFFDMYELCKIFTPHQLRDMFLEKYGRERINCYHILKSLFYFDDAENSPEPVSLKGITWQEIKKFFIDNEQRLTRELLC